MVGSLRSVSQCDNLQRLYSTYLGLVVAGFVFSVAAVFAFALAVGAVAVDARNDVWLVFGVGAAALGGSFEAAGFVVGFAVGLAAAAGFETGAVADFFGVVGTLGAALGSGLLIGVDLDADALEVEIAVGFLGSSLPFVAGVPFDFSLFAAGFGVLTAGSAGPVVAASVFAGASSSAAGGTASPSDTAAASVGSAGFIETSS